MSDVETVALRLKWTDIDYVNSTIRVTPEKVIHAHPSCHATTRPQNIKNTLIYTQIVNFKDDAFICKAAENVKEAKELIEASYQYVCDVDNLKLFRKHK